MPHFAPYNPAVDKGQRRTRKLLMMIFQASIGWKSIFRIIDNKIQTYFPKSTTSHSISHFNYQVIYFFISLPHVFTRLQRHIAQYDDLVQSQNKLQNIKVNPHKIRGTNCTDIYLPSHLKSHDDQASDYPDISRQSCCNKYTKRFEEQSFL